VAQGVPSHANMAVFSPTGVSVAPRSHAPSTRVADGTAAPPRRVFRAGEADRRRLRPDVPAHRDA
jgi:hypothetical protein